MGFADFDIMGKCKTIIEKVEEIATNLSEVKTSASGAKTSADNAKTSADNAVSVIGATGNTGGSATAGTVMGKLNKLITDLTTHMGRWTNTRAGYIDNIRSYTLTNNTANKTGVLSQKLAYVIGLLENSSYGLASANKYYKPSDNVLQTFVNTETYISKQWTTVQTKAVFWGKYIPKHDGVVRVKCTLKGSGTSGSNSYGGKELFIALSADNQNPVVSASAIYPEQRYAELLTSTADIDTPGTIIDISSSTVQASIFSGPITMSNLTTEYVDLVQTIPVTKNKPVIFISNLLKLSSSSSTQASPYISSLTVCGSEVSS